MRTINKSIATLSRDNERKSIHTTETTERKTQENKKHGKNKWKFPNITTFIYPKDVPKQSNSSTTQKEIVNHNSNLLTQVLKENLLKNSKIYKRLNSVQIYKLILHQISSNKTTQITKFEFGKSRRFLHPNEKVIMN